MNPSGRRDLEDTPNNACTSGDPHAGRGGVVPSREHRWQPGQCGNPKGRPSAGATLTEWVNVLAEQNLTEAKLRRIVARAKDPWLKRAAALRILRMLENPDLADYQDALDGIQTLQEARELGVRTDAVKKFHRKVTTTRTGEEVVETEIELHDRAGIEFDRLCDRTEGRPTRRQQKYLDTHLRTPDEGAAKAAEILNRLNRLKERFGLRISAN
jgi:hypothetical protein